MRDDDLFRFRDCFRAAELPSHTPFDPGDVLDKDKGLFPEEIWRLAQSLQVASVLGDADRREAVVADFIARHAQQQSIRYVNFDQGVAWQRIIAWALAQLTVIHQTEHSAGFTDRSVQVGQACRRLRDQGYEISVTAYGVEMSAKTMKAISNRIDGLIGHIGGFEIITQICHQIEARKLIHDGMWLLGDRVPRIWSSKRPAFPVGWVFSLGLRHLGTGGNARNAAVAWQTVVQLATDLAAAMDCQRYNQFEDVDIRPASSWRVLRDSLLWREIFGLPQVPPQVLPSLREALRASIVEDEERLFEWSLEASFDELDDLLSHSVNNQPTTHRRDEIIRRYPNLWKAGVGEAGRVNSNYVGPTAGGARNQSNFIFFSRNKDIVLTMPAPLLREAFCQSTFTQIWKKLKASRASEVIGKVFERMLERACAGKAPYVRPCVKYAVDNQIFEIDVATRDNDRIVLFETKAKSLTAQARSGDMMKFFADYTDSYLAIVLQLVRHEDYLRLGLTPLTAEGEISNNLRPLKVAVSPLSHGPASDKMLASGLLRSFANVALHPVSSDAGDKKVTENFNKAVRQIYERVTKLAPKKNDGTVDLFAYFLDIFWLDLGEVLYVLDRANSVIEAFTPLQFVTFMSRDFWTEVAIADAGGLTKNKWRSLG